MLTTDHYYNNYIRQAAGLTVDEALQAGLESFLQLIPTLSEEKWGYRYAPEKWSIKELVQHITDSERIFSYRALCFARGETQVLPPFDENVYAQNSFADYRTGESIAEEFKAVRNSTVLMFKGFTAGMLNRSGSANNTELTVNETGLIIAGHQLHHIKILKERYL